MTPEGNHPAPFFPRGAIAFFLLMAAFYAGSWFVLYYLMTQRG